MPTTLRTVELPIIHNHIFRQHVNFRFIYRVRNPPEPDGTPGDPIDNTGWRVDMDIRQLPSMESIDRISTEAPSGGEITLGGEDGLITINIPGTTIAGYPAPGILYYDILETYSDGSNALRFRGSVTLEKINTYSP